jgi:hypothetical protein
VTGKPIPERAPIGDRFNGLILQCGERQALALSPQPEAETLSSGSFVVRYGLRYLGKPHLSVVPGMVVLDYGDFLTGEEAWEFLTERSNLYPRSEVFGYLNNGSDEMTVIKALDLSIPPEVLVYTDAGATTPIAHPTALIDKSADTFPPRLLEFLPRFPTVTDWQAVL